MLTLSYSQSREKLLSNVTPGSVCAEIGVWKGDFSSFILNTIDPSEINLIDPWTYQTAYGNRWYGGMKAKCQEDMDQIYREVSAKFAVYPSVKIHRLYSSQAESIFDDGYFDFVYIDGNHYYDFVKQDLANYFSKVKSGGFLTGDDFFWTSPELNEKKPVQQAVYEFVASHTDNINRFEIIGSQYLIEKR